MKRKPLSLAGQVVVFIIIAIALFWVLFPFYWAFLNSIKKPAETFQPTWIPFLQFTPTLEHWQSELAIPEIRRAVLNSTLISVGAATLAVPLGTMAAYALARFRFRRPANGTLTTWFLSQRVMPPVLFVIPFFLIMRQLRLLDSVWALILLNATFTLPFPVIILSQMFRELPAELEDAARVDGASRFQAFYRIALPLVAPGVGTPVPGGLTYREAHLVCELIAKTEGLRSLEFVEVNPILDERNRTGELAVELIQSALGKTILR